MKKTSERLIISTVQVKKVWKFQKNSVVVQKVSLERVEVSLERSEDSLERSEDSLERSEDSLERSKDSLERLLLLYYNFFIKGCQVVKTPVYKGGCNLFEVDRG